jgi:hypothetical protein
MKVLGRIPYDPGVYRSVQDGAPVMEYQIPAADAMRRVWHAAKEQMNMKTGDLPR